MINKTILDNGDIEISFTIEDIDKDCYCYGNFYKTIGLIEEFKNHRDKADVKNIKANAETEAKIRDKIRDNFRLVNLRYYPKLKVEKYRVKRKTLTKNEENTIGMDYLNYSPTVDCDVEDMVIRFEIH